MNPLYLVIIKIIIIIY